MALAFSPHENMSRPDISDYLAHFTTDRAPCSADKDNPTLDVAGKSAYDRLVAILESKSIRASKLPWVSRNACCFTECPWASLLAHAERYSSYGVGFAKPRIFAAGGGPVYYVRADHWDKQTWDEHLKTFATPFWPAYRSEKLKDAKYLNGTTCDFSHEREWRIPHDFIFQYTHVEFVIVATYEDMAKFPQNLKDEIGRDKFLIMDQYRAVESLWPVHLT